MISEEIFMLSIPFIKKDEFEFDGVKWGLYFDQDLEYLFADQDGLDPDFISTLMKYRFIGSDDYNGHRQVVVFRGVDFLVGFKANKNIHIGTPHLAREIFLIENLASNEKQGDDFKSFIENYEAIKNIDIDAFPSVIDEITKRQELANLSQLEQERELDKETQEMTQQLAGHITDYKSTFFEKITDFGLNLTALYSLIRIHLLKFLALLPSLDHDKSGKEVKRIFLETLRRVDEDSRKLKAQKNKIDLPLPGFYLFIMKVLAVVSSFTPPRPLSIMIRIAVRALAKRFIAGESIESATKCFNELRDTGRDATLDQLGELVVSNKEADHYLEGVLKLVRGVSQHIIPGERNASGILKANVSIKVSALCADFNPQDFDYTYDQIAPRLKKILLEAKKEQVYINIDSEHYHGRNIVLDIYGKILIKTLELKDYKDTGFVLQAYLRDASEHLDDIIAIAKKRGLTMPIRLVKGAYWDAETIEANVHDFNAPQFLNKEETDIYFRQMIIKILKNYPHLQLTLASHNLADHCFAEVARKKLCPDTPLVEHQTLHMTYEGLSMGMTKMGWPTRNYVPIGSLLVGMAYLVRRIMENSSQVGILSIMRSHKNVATFSAPQVIHQTRKQKRDLVRDRSISHLDSEFFNVRPLRPYLSVEKGDLDEALDKFKKEDLGKDYPTACPFELNGPVHEVYSSSDPSMLVGKIKMASADIDAQKAIDIAHSSYVNGSWKNAPAIHRASVLVRASDIMKLQRLELAALICYEAGKSIIESLADVDEAIDFLTFYAREEVKLDKQNKGLDSRGVSVVISPWNFPLAIPTGMTSAALCAGNSVILKSAKHTPLVANVYADIMHQAGVPKDVFIHLAGDGRTMGKVLVEDKRVSSYVFTGSKAVGVWISEVAGKRMYKHPTLDSHYPVKVISEMGGKNAVIITANAELDETVSGCLYATYAHAGQKCSAASRIIVDNSIKERFIERFVEASKDLQVGKAWEHKTYMNPVVCQADKERLQAEVKEAVLEAERLGGKVLIDRSQDDLPGCCVGPAVIELPVSKVIHGKTYAHKELFGPVVHVIGVENIDQALEVFNGTEYALTGGVFAQSQDDIDYIIEKAKCGNFYVNRSNTGARVAIEPFGGFKLSGTGPKAGSRSYLRAFHGGKIATSNYDSMAGELGSDYDFDLCLPIAHGSDVRLSKIITGMEVIKENLGKLYGLKEQKEDVANFANWIKDHYHDFVKAQHLNRVIPGQLSYDNEFLIKETGVLIAYSGEINSRILMHFLSSLIVGSGLTIIARNVKSHQLWTTICDAFHKRGISKNILDVHFASDKRMCKTLINEELTHVIVDGNVEQVQKVLDHTFGQNYQPTKYMVSVHTAFENEYHNGGGCVDYPVYLRQFIYTRSLAINTMRHGAPLDLSL